MNTRFPLARTATAVCAMVISLTTPLRAADHRDAPILIGSGVSADINDVYIFQSPANSNNTVLIMTVNPMAGFLGPVDFDPSTKFEFHIDSVGGDAKADAVICLDFGKVRSDGSQSVKVTHASRGRKVLIAEGQVGEEARVMGGGMVRCDLFDDPFFFDYHGFRDGYEFTGDDFFRGFDVLGIVIEVPTSFLTAGGPNIGIWAVTRRGQRQIDRAARPGINTFLIPAELKEAFNQGDPRNDLRDFRDAVIGTLSGPPFNQTPGNAEALSEILLPDVLTFNTANSAGLLNGRRLEDDVIDAELNLLTGGAITTDGVDRNDAPFSTSFPYLGQRR